MATADNASSAEDFKPLHGACICGSLTYDVLSPPSGKPGLCHCNNCKRQTGSMFSTNVLVSRSSLKITGPYNCWTRPEDSAHMDQTKDWGLAFCPSCGTQFCAFPESIPEMAVLRMGTLDPEDIERLGRPGLEMFCMRKVGWLGDVEGAMRFEELPKRG